MHEITRRVVICAAAAVTVVASGTAALAAEMAPAAGKRVALKGYDPVSYFAPRDTLMAQ